MPNNNGIANVCYKLLYEMLMGNEAILLHYSVDFYSFLVLLAGFEIVLLNRFDKDAASFDLKRTIRNQFIAPGVQARSFGIQDRKNQFRNRRFLWDPLLKQLLISFHKRSFGKSPFSKKISPAYHPVKFT